MEQERLSKVLNGAIVVVGCAMALYHLISTQYLIWGVYQHQALHLLFALTLVFLNTLKTMKRRKLWPLVVALLLAGLTVTSYILVRSDYLDSWVGFIPSTTVWVMGILLTIVVIEATRQAWGWILPIVCVVFILYFLYGHLAPGAFRHSPFQASFVLSMLGIGMHGIFSLLHVSANYIFLFVLFGGLIGAFGVHGFFIQIGRAVGRRLAGGTAQTAVVSSALVGMVMGQAVSNVLVTGAFTIPLMKRTGYKPDEAAAIEAAASSGGQMMPPVMGESIFLMAVLMGMAYIDIALAAIIPAVLYFLSVGLGVQVIAYRNKIPRPIEKVDMGEILLRGPLFIIPLTVLMVILFMRYTPMYAAFYAILAAVLVSFLRKGTRLSLGALAKGFADGAVLGAKICVAVALLAMVIQVVYTTGVGAMIASVVEEVSGGQLWLALIMTMFISLILGMGMPTLAAYLLVAIIVAPVLVNMGVPLLAAHFFVFWFAIFSTLTPPVAIGAMAASAIAGGRFVKTSIEAFRLASAGFILPYVIVFSPVLTLHSSAPLEAGLTLIAVVFGLAALVTTLYGHFLVPTPPWERLFFALASGGLFGFCFTKIYILFAAGLLLFSVLTFWQWKRRRVEVRGSQAT